MSRVINGVSTVTASNQVKVEKAIAKKYGEETIQHPKKHWTDEKEKDYVEQLKQVHKHHDDAVDYDREEVNGIFIPKKLLNRESDRTCPTCGVYSFKPNDDIYMIKFGCCFECYVKWVEDREERWQNGWRPNK